MSADAELLGGLGLGVDIFFATFGEMDRYKGVSGIKGAVAMQLSVVLDVAIPVAASYAGAWVGASALGLMGAGEGTAVAPGPGTVAGALGEGTVGAVAGAAAGAVLGGEFSEQLDERIYNAAVGK
jgi:hypothetical protein